jgi:hypothetical protein
MANIPERIVQRFAQKHGIEEHDASIIFRDLETFLDDASNKALSPAPRIDEAWHEFILHTKDYIAFCEQRYGKIVHHVPTPLSCDSDDPNKQRCGSGVQQVLANCSKCSSDCKSVGVADG